MKDAPDLTQAEVYDLLGRWGGYLDDRGRSVIDHFLERMAYPEQLVGYVRAEAGDKLYYATLALLARLQSFAAAGIEECPPPAPHPRERRNRAREAVAERHAAGEAWRKMTKGTK